MVFSNYPNTVIKNNSLFLRGYYELLW